MTIRQILAIGVAVFRFRVTEKLSHLISVGKMVPYPPLSPLHGNVGRTLGNSSRMAATISIVVKHPHFPRPSPLSSPPPPPVVSHPPCRHTLSLSLPLPCSRVDPPCGNSSCRSALLSPVATKPATPHSSTFNHNSQPKTSPTPGTFATSSSQPDPPSPIEEG